MTCRDLTRFLADYLDGGLPPAIRRRFDAHLAVCPDCVTYLRDYREAVRLSAASADDEGPRDVPDDLVAAVVRTLREEPANSYRG